jgi:hypothetical protein
MHFCSVEREVFDVSTRMVVGDGETALFWVDKWLDDTAIRDIAPDLFVLIPKRARKRRTVREVLVERRWITDIQGATSSLALWQYVQLRVQDVQLIPIPDTLLWRWTTDAQYSSKSCYESLFQGSSSTSGWLAKIDAAPERLARRGLPHDQAEESMQHLLVDCPFSRTVWHEVLSWVRSTARDHQGGEPTL